MGSALFGVSRRDVTKSVSFAYPVTKNLIASLGYQKNESSLDYYKTIPNIKIYVRRLIHIN